MKLFIPEFTYCFCGAPAVETITVEGQSRKRRIRQSNATKHWRPTLTAIAEEGVAREVRRQREPGAGFRSEKRPLIKSKLAGKTRSDSYGSDYRTNGIIKYLLSQKTRLQKGSTVRIVSDGGKLK
uniref:Uncharacterized protein n=1 Tax=Tanacetum cinerariifolium TaxID=118510 RepID=A0A6L2MX91_TANCI|nr:hypothetical protein [Tanacetum cinerariifolium]